MIPPINQSTRYPMGMETFKKPGKGRKVSRVDEIPNGNGN